MIHPLAGYSDPAIVRFWTPEWNVHLERRFWVRILEWMNDNEVFDYDPMKVIAYGHTIDDIDLDSIKQRELVTRHDVKARIEEFNYLATEWYRANVGPCGSLELIHAGMTSADVVDNVSLIKIRQSIEHLSRRRPDTRLSQLWEAIPFRGVKGPVGTQQDMVDLLGGKATADRLDKFLAGQYGFKKISNSVGQVYPRSIDFQVASTLYGVVCDQGAPQPWATILAGYMQMTAEYSGDQWNEGDVSTSVVRRVALPGMFMAVSAALRGVKP